MNQNFIAKPEYVLGKERINKIQWHWIWLNHWPKNKTSYLTLLARKAFDIFLISRCHKSLTSPYRFTTNQLGKYCMGTKTLMISRKRFWLLRFSTTCGRPTNAFFVAVNQMFGGSSQLTTTAEHCFVVWTVHNDHDLITACSAVVGSWEEPRRTFDWR